MAKLVLDDEDVATIAAKVAALLGKTPPVVVPPPPPPSVPPVVSAPPVVQPPTPPVVANPDGSLPRLTGAALHAVLTGNFKNAAGEYSLPGVPPSLAMQYVQQYLGQPWYDPTISELANMPDGDFREMLARYSTPAEWLVSRNKRATALDKYGSTWAKVLPFAAR